MTRLRLPAVLALLLLTGSGAQAQNIFELLFGSAPQKPAAPFNAAPPPLPQEDAGPRKPAPTPVPVVARPVAVKAPSEDAILGRELKQNGTNGSLKIERAGRGDLKVRLTLAGRRSAQSVETCAIPLGGSEGLPLVSQGRPEGAARYQVAEPTCPLQIDILDDAVLVKGPSEICVFAGASCQVDPSGLWGPEPAQLFSRSRDFEQTRASADKAVRDNYKVLAQRANPQTVRPIVAEQAAFSSDREMVCRSYAREGSHSFCNARVTEARALSLATRLGVSTVTAANAPAPEVRRRRNDAMGLPPTEEITQRRGLDGDD